MTNEATNEVKEYCTRAVVRYLDGDMDEFQRLTGIALEMHRENGCTKCGGTTIKARRKTGKGKYIKIELCPECGTE